MVNLGLEGHYKKWSSQLTSALQTPQTEKCDCGKENATTCCQTLTNGNHTTTEIHEKDGDEEAEEELRIESDDDYEAGGCKNGNDDIMDLEDMGDYVETSFVTKVRYRSNEVASANALLRHPKVLQRKWSLH